MHPQATLAFLARLAFLATLVSLTAVVAAAQPQTAGPPGRDTFAAIALDSRPAARPGVREKTPPVLPDLRVESRVPDSRVVFPQYSALRTPAGFRQALAEMKSRYAPFLRDLTPAARPTRATENLDQFEFRYEDPADRTDFARVSAGAGQWQAARIPDYRGPIGPWVGYYRKVLRPSAAIRAAERQVLRFGACDYRCEVYLNGRMVGAHTGLFAPFEIDVTGGLRDGDNVLVVRVENDFASLGGTSWRGPDINGEKIYAAVGPGWNEPVTGWHHCPPGAGLWQKVTLEGRARLVVRDIFVRPDPARQAAEVEIEVFHAEPRNRALELRLAIYPKNFAGPAREGIALETPDAGPGASTYRARLHVGQLRAWTPDQPWLYTLRATLSDPQSAAVLDVRDTHFGVRTFTMDDTSPEGKGTFYLNGEPVILRGANTMGNFMRPVMEGNLDRVVEDILIAKLAHMNYVRLTQSPVQPEIYDLCDRLGLMLQTDLPLFGYLRRTTVEEAIRQAGEMERLIRGHPSSIQISYINEPFAADAQKKAHRFVTRGEMERFFTAASELVHFYNPDRVIKPVDGDYDPPAPGMPDNHIYSGWYGSHGVPIGKFARGYWIANKDGWKHGSGEYGSEGLDDAATMFRRFPKAWLPASPADRWSPLAIPSAQTGTMHQGWFDAQETLAEWVAASQRHQAWATRTMTRAFRRQSDRIVSTAIHLLIDAWPSGWMKSLVDVDRNPKPAYFEFRDALTPLLADIRTDRTRYYAGEDLQIEFWIANDGRAPAGGPHRLVWELWRGAERIFAQSGPAALPSYGAAFQGYFRPAAPRVTRREKLRIRLGLCDGQGAAIHSSEIEVEVFPAPAPERNRDRRVAVVGQVGGRAWKLAEALGAVPVRLAESASAGSGPVLVDTPDAFDAVREQVMARARSGATVVFLEQAPGAVWRLGETDVRVLALPPKEFVSRKTGHPLTAGFEPFDFAHWYDPARDYPAYAAASRLEGTGLQAVLISAQSPPPGKPEAGPSPALVAAELPAGAGSLVFSQILASPRLQHEPPARVWFQALLEYRAGAQRNP